MMNNTNGRWYSKTERYKLAPAIYTLSTYICYFGSMRIYSFVSFQHIIPIQPHCTT